jgi:ATP-dependent RNA helicase DHX29
MAKKKSKKTKQDARGYSTSVATKPVAPVASTKATHENLNQLKSILDNHVNEPTISPNAHLLDTGSKRFFKKIESLHDELVYCGFSGHHIQSVIQALGETSGVFSLESALNWLCLNLDDDLPPLFREQCLVETREVDCSAIVEVVKPSNKNLMEPSEIRFDDSVHQHLLFESTKSEEEGEGARKSWILSQYQYEDATEDVNDEGHAQEEKAEKCEEEGEELCAEELRLAILEREIKELRESVNDEASNYLRSKQEVKALKSDLAKLESLAKKRRGEAAKAKAERESLRSPGEIEQEEEEEEMVGFDIFNTYEDNKEGQTQSSQPATAHLSSTQSASEFDKDNLFVLSSTGPSIAKGWTGTTPKHQLEEYCRKQKIPRPTFSQLNYTKNGCKVHVLAKPQMSIEQNGPFYSFADAQQFVATIALYRMNPELPMYRMFPPVFSGLWKSWVDKEKTALSIQRQEDRAEKERKIQKLIDLIPATLRADGSSEKLHGRRVDRETKGYASSEGGASINGAAKERQSTKSQSGSGLQDEFLSRSRTAEYENMQKERSALPMYSFREELLETVSNNSAIVLCAETGAGKTTQGPQFILEDALMRGNGDKISIICTQPRRISAMSVADRVAEEMCVKLGDLVGYQIRGEAVKSSRTKLLFCTTGVILRRLHGDPTLSGVSLVVCDEVHERSWQNDFLLVVLRRLIRTSRPDLKVLLVCDNVTGQNESLSVRAS